MNKKKLEKLIEKIKKNEVKNPELLEEFFNNQYEIMNDFLADSIDIVSYCFKQNELDDLKKGEMLDSLRYFQERFCYRLTNLPCVEKEDIILLLDVLTSYNKLCKHLKTLKLEENDNFKISIDSYINSPMDFFFIEILMKDLHENYYERSVDEILMIMDLITTNEAFQKLLFLGRKDVDKNKHLLYTYIDNILPIVPFISQNYIQEDPVVQAIVSKQIKNLNVTEYFLNNLSIEKLLDIFIDIRAILNFIRSLKTSIFRRKDLVVNLFEKALISDNSYFLLKLYQNDYQDPDFQDIIDDYQEEIFRDIVRECTFNKEDIQTLVASNSWDLDFVTNAMSMTRDFGILRIFKDKGYFQEVDYVVKMQAEDSLEQLVEKCNYYNRTGRVIPYEFTQKLLANYFVNKVDLDVNSVEAIIRSLLLNLSHVEYVLFSNSSLTGGTFDEHKNIIIISHERIENFLDSKLDWKSRIKLFQTMFHEYRHSLQPWYEILEPTLAKVLYAETVLNDFDVDFYNYNYNNSELENDANYYMNIYTWKFLNQFMLPFDISYLLEIPKKKSTKISHSNLKQKVPLTKAYEKLISFHPEVEDYFKRFIENETLHL